MHPFESRGFVSVSWTFLFLKQLRHAMQGRTMQNKRAKYSNVSQPKIHKFVVECTSVRHYIVFIGYSKMFEVTAAHFHAATPSTAANQTTRKSGVAIQIGLNRPK